jgi:hypothetical protein
MDDHRGPPPALTWRIAAAHRPGLLLAPHRLGFAVPESISSSDPAQLTSFARRGRTVIKTCCGMRATTREISPGQLRGYSAERGPVHLQRLIEGPDIRVHVLGPELHALRIEGSQALDYRTDRQARFSSVTLPAELAELLLEGTRAQGLVFSGWDLKVDSDGRFWCLESNPMPGYSFYDSHSNGRISKALMDQLWEHAG